MVNDDDLNSGSPGKLAEEKSSRRRTVLLVASSALFGGIAVVLWNRRALQGMREPVEPETGPLSPDAEEFI